MLVFKDFDLSLGVVITWTKHLSPWRSKFVAFQSFLAFFEPAKARVPKAQMKSENSSAARIGSTITPSRKGA